MGIASHISEHRYFTEFTTSKAILYTIASIYVVSASVIVMVQPFVNIPCTYIPDGNEPNTENVLYHYNPCRLRRYKVLLGLTVEECEFGRRLVWAVVLGCCIGWERKQADRPAGIRTMSLVALGSCLFSICSAFAFLSGPMAWDASRVSAAIPSGVGFLGSALIFKHKDEKTNAHEVHGLTTAASVWLSAAVGIACAGGLYFVASLSTAIMMVLLRFGPRTNFPLEEEDGEGDEESTLGGGSHIIATPNTNHPKSDDPTHQLEVEAAIAAHNASHPTPKNYQSVPEMQLLLNRMGSERSTERKRTSQPSHRSRPSLI